MLEVPKNSQVPRNMQFSKSARAAISQKPAILIVTGFKTEKGSTYLLNKDGTTVRDKAKRDDVGHEGDFGLKTCSAVTIYVENSQQATCLSGAGMESPLGKGFHVLIKDGKASLAWWNIKKNGWGSPTQHRNIPFYTEPGIGRYPVELWKPTQLEGMNGLTLYSNQHAGNRIVEMTTATKYGNE